MDAATYQALGLGDVSLEEESREFVDPRRDAAGAAVTDPTPHSDGGTGGQASSSSSRAAAGRWLTRNGCVPAQADTSYQPAPESRERGPGVPQGRVIECASDPCPAALLPCCRPAPPAAAVPGRA